MEQLDTILAMFEEMNEDIREIKNKISSIDQRFTDFFIKMNSSKNKIDGF